MRADGKAGLDQREFFKVVGALAFWAHAIQNRYLKNPGPLVS